MNDSMSKRRSGRRRVIAEFPHWVENSMSVLVHNILEIHKCTPPRPVTNKVLVFLVNYTCWGVADRLVLRVTEAAILLRSELSEIGIANPLEEDKDFKKLKRVRDKITAHVVENMAEEPRHMEWHKTNNSNLQVFLPFVYTVAQKISMHIQSYQSQDILPLKNYETLPMHEKFDHVDVEAILEALATHRLL